MERKKTRRCSPKRLRRRRGRLLPLILLLTLVASAVVGGSVAKYVHQDSGSGTIKAKMFYFTSNLLDGNTHTLNAGTTEISFTLGNHEDELRYADMDITYTVTVDNGATVKDESGTLKSGSVQDATITLSGLQDGKTYKVTATGTGGYKKTLTATFKVLSASNAVYQSVDLTDPSFVLVTVWSQGYTGNVTVTYPSSLVPDNTDPVMKDVTNSTTTFTDSTTFAESSVSSEGVYRSHVYRFFGDHDDLTASDFTVTYGTDNTPATTSKPN